VLCLRHCIKFRADSTVQLFSGFRGTGKSTELRRLQRDLVERGYLVALCDMERYLNLSMPVDVSDFLVAVAGAFGEALEADHLLGKDAGRPSYWSRFGDFLKTRIELDSMGLQGIKANLKEDPDFKERIQRRMKGHLGALVADVREFLAAGVKALRKRHGADRGVVLLLDSVEHLQGTSQNAVAVHDSLENLFAGHPDKLRFQSMHVVYTVPPWLKIRSPGVVGHFDGGEVLPCVKVRDQNRGQPHAAGVQALEELVGRRGDWKRLLGDDVQLSRVVLASGGYLRDLFRILQSVLLLAAQRGTLPVSVDLVDLAIADVRNSYLPVPIKDAMWLERVSRSHRAELDDTAALVALARFFDTHLVLCYRNGREWYDVHPLIKEHVQELAALAAGPQE